MIKKMVVSPKRLLVLGVGVAWPLQANAASQLSGALAAKQTSASYREFVELLALPNDATVPADIQKNAAWLEQAFQKRGFQTLQLPNAGKPMLYAELPGAEPSRKTVLFYMHLDGQSVTPQQWQQPSPWQATLKQRDSRGEWEVIPLERLYGGQVDPEWRLFARSSSDDKG